MRSQQLSVLTAWIVLQFFCGICSTVLLINVRNQGGEIIQENLTSNTTDDVITLEFQRSDGTLVTQVVDFKNEVLIIKALVLGEMEQGQNQYQTLCFVTHFYDKDFISSDAMAKLRQKNPSTVRVAEINRNYANYSMNLFLDVFQSNVISKHINDFCFEAAGSTFTRHEDVKKWAQRPDSSKTALLAAVHNFTIITSSQTTSNKTKSQSLSKCADTSTYTAPCTCSLELCISWYPCGLKFCKNKEEKDKPGLSYRCGIKTCKKCYIFSYYSKMKENCLWDE
ncbi:out at first protein [Copidosoma floridanum]|uniref:out at first protein n=1 Tax=Copidosoma floridanum TaxID=29053 RepID=UPI0006C98C23|nr:out at first protein [Copidosoma floridanum]